KTPPVRDVPKTEPVRPETRNLQPPKPDPGRPLPKWLIPGIAAAVAVIALIISVGSGGKKSTPASSVKAPAAQAAAEPAPTRAVPTVPMEVHTMAQAEWVSECDTFFWGQERYMRKDVKTLTFQSSMQNVPNSAWDVSEAGDKSVLAWMDNGDLYVAADGAIAPNSNASWLFQEFVNLKTIDFGNCFITSSVTRMSGMFDDCSSLISLDLSGFDTSSVTGMYAMFFGCSSLTTLDLTSFDTSSVTTMDSMFYGCSSLTTLDLTSFGTSNVTTMESMFSECKSLVSLNLTNFDTSSVTSMGFMFVKCNSLTSLDLSSFDTSNVTYMNWMFSWCSSLTSLNLSRFDASAVAGMYSMFYGCDNLPNIICSDSKILNEFRSR
ncbi:MAG: BspA family leucine-rich repeat surface protein, partial [Oscillospiraceae bacterium]|nr:BspA family leucine-rich repeat surface protein [Oscillospiraceae bacterium]